jgi:hypothetical protein
VLSKSAGLGMKKQNYSLGYPRPAKANGRKKHAEKNKKLHSGPRERVARIPGENRRDEMAKKNKTKAERDHLNRVAELGCIACINLGYQDTPAEIHHIKTGIGIGQRASSFQTIPLCFHHHSAQGADGYHGAPTAWQTKHGAELALLAQVRALL